jgi:hypothetical protein
VNREHLEELRAFAESRGLPFRAVSSASGEGIVDLVRLIADTLDRIPKQPVPAGENEPSPDSGNDKAETHPAEQN